METVTAETRSGFLSAATARKSIAGLLDQGVVSVANFLTGLIVGRICTKEQFGLYMLGFTIITIAMDFQDSLISAPYTTFRPRMEGSALAQYTGSNFLYQLTLSAVIILLLIVTRAVLSLGIGPPGLDAVVETLIFVVLFILLRHFARNISFSALDMKKAMMLDTTVSVLQLGMLYLLAHLGLLTASTAFWTVGAACGAGLLPWLLSSNGEFQLRGGAAWMHLRQNLSIGLWLLASGFAWTVGASLYPWLLAGFHGTAATGVWAACFWIIGLLNPLFLGLQNSLGPKIAHTYAGGGEADLRRFSLQASAALAALIAPFSLALLYWGGGFVTGFFGKKYDGNDLVVSILAVNFLVSAMAFPPSRALLTVQRADVDFKINLSLLVFLLLFGVLLVRPYGPLGAAIGLLASNSICLIFRYTAFLRFVQHRAAPSPSPQDQPALLRRP